MYRTPVVVALALLAVGACSGGSAAPPRCSETFTNGSEHTVAEYERGCVDDDGTLVTFTRYECQSSTRPDLYHADGLGSGRPKGSGLFLTEGRDGVPNYAIVDYCLESEPSG